MSSITLIKPPAPPRAASPLTFGELLEQILPAIGLVVVAGPPVFLLLGSLFVGVLMLVGPFALIATLVVLVGVVVVAATALAALTRAIARQLVAATSRHGAR